MKTLDYIVIGAIGIVSFIALFRQPDTPEYTMPWQPGSGNNTDSDDEETWVPPDDWEPPNSGNTGENDEVITVPNPENDPNTGEELPDHIPDETREIIDRYY